MPVKLLLTSQLRATLKRPLGILVRGDFVETAKRLKNMVAEEDFPNIIAVGDTVSKNLVRSGFVPKLLIVDNKSKRRSVKPAKLPTDRTVYVINPRGTITEEAETAVEEALKNDKSTKIVVDGEEDLLTLVAVVHASERSYVIYGQPNEGIVVIKVTAGKKAEVARILESMKNPLKT